MPRVVPQSEAVRSFAIARKVCQTDAMIRRPVSTALCGFVPFLFLITVSLLWSAPALLGAGGLDDLAKPQSGRSMRATSTMRQGEVRRGGGERKLDPKADPKGDLEEASNFDNFRVPPGETHVLLDAQGPGVITHIWITFLGPERQAWAQQGSANHQEMLLRMYWDGRARPAVEAPVGISSPTASDCAARSSASRWWSRTPTPTIVSGTCRFGNRRGSKSSTRATSRSASFTTTSIGSRRSPCPRTRPTSTPSIARSTRPENGKDYVVLETTGKGHYVGTVLAVRTRSPAWFGEGDEKIYIDGEAKPSIWGTGHRRLLPFGVGAEDHQHAVLRRAVLRSMGHCGRQDQRLPMAYPRSAGVQHRHQSHLRALRLDFARREPRQQVNQLERARGRLRQRRVLVSDRRTDFHRPRPARPGASLPNLERVMVYARDFADAAHHGAGEATPQDLDFYEGAQLLYRATQADGAWIEVPFEIAKKEPLRLLLNATKSYDFGRYQALLNGVKIGAPSTSTTPRLPAKRSTCSISGLTRAVTRSGSNASARTPRPRAITVGLESVRLRERRPRVAEFGHDKDKDWRKEQALYQ